jgi:predicted ferric reductase
VQLFLTQHPTRTVADVNVQTEIHVLLSTKAPYIKASDEEKAKRPKLMSRYLAINRSVCEQKEQNDFYVKVTQENTHMGEVEKISLLRRILSFTTICRN